MLWKIELETWVKKNFRREKNVKCLMRYQWTESQHTYIGFYQYIYQININSLYAIRWLTLRLPHQGTFEGKKEWKIKTNLTHTLLFCYKICHKKHLLVFGGAQHNRRTTTEKKLYFFVLFSCRSRSNI